MSANPSPLAQQLARLFALALRLYPGGVRREYAGEMQAVFHLKAADAAHQSAGRLLVLACREARDLPLAILSAHYSTIRGRMQSSVPTPSNQTRWPILLGLLPFLLVLLVNGLTLLLVEGGLAAPDNAAQRAMNIGLPIVSVIAILAIFALAWRQKWPAWSATWYPFFGILPLALVAMLINWLVEGQITTNITQEIVMYTIIPLAVAVLLYTVVRQDPRRSLLAALPVIYFLWSRNMEFVNAVTEISIQVAGTILFCLAIAFVLRSGDWRRGLYIILGMNLAIGALFAFAGTYHGGTLLGSAPGPNPIEVIRSLIPQYLATGALLMGPLFALKYRQAGRSNGRAAKIAYHLVLAGLLLVILANLTGVALTTGDNSPVQAGSAANAMGPVIFVGIIAYLAGLIWLYWRTPLPKTASGWIERILLAVLPLALPLAFVTTFITWLWPVSFLYGIPLLWVLPDAVILAIGLVWLGLSVWVVTRGGEDSRSEVSLREISEAPIPSQ